jgi:hypothetical protein
MSDYDWMQDHADAPWWQGPLLALGLLCGIVAVILSVVA